MRLSRVERSLLYAGVLLGIVAHGPGAFAQTAPATPAAAAPGAPAAPPGLVKLKGGQDRITPSTSKEAGAKITGRFANANILNESTDKIRKDSAGPCDSVTSVTDAGANSVAIVCDKGQHAYFMQRSGDAWGYQAPVLLVPASPPSGK